MTDGSFNKRRIELVAIGTVRSPFTEQSGTPIQTTYAADVEGLVVVDEAFAAALTDIDDFDRIWLIYALDRAKLFAPLVTPYRDTQPRGLFATRSPCRPNPIGMSPVQLIDRKENVLRVRGIDVLDGTPLLDIKPYVPEFDAYPNIAAGWFDQCDDTARTTADDRFHNTAKDETEQK